MSRLNDYLSKAILFSKELQISSFAQPDETEKIREVIEKCRSNVENSDRRIKVAIAGKMNTGKSMLVDNLFFQGQGIVSSNEIPSTARLSTLYYSEKEHAVIRFVSMKDIERLKKIAERYDQDSGEADKAAYELYAAIKDNIKDYEKILGKEIEVALDNLSDYSDAQGKYTGFVKSIDIYINQPILKDVEIIDTPGLGDPVVSREEITNEKMDDVDIVIFLSYSSMFMDDSDINYYLFLRKKGIQNVIILASRFDEVLTSKDYSENNPAASQQFLSVKDNFLARFKQYNDFENYIPGDVYPSMPLIAKIYYILFRKAVLNEVLAFYKKKIEKKLKVDFEDSAVIDVSGINLITNKLVGIKEMKEEKIFISNKNSVLACYKLVSGLLQNKLFDYKKKKTEIEIELEDPGLLEKIKKEIKNLSAELENIFLQTKAEAINNIIRPKCESFKEMYKGYLRSLGSDVDSQFEWLKTNQKEPGNVARNIRNSISITSTNIIELFDVSLIDTFGIGQSGSLYNKMLNDLKKRVEPVKLKSLESNIKSTESVSNLLQQLKETVYIHYMDKLIGEVGPCITQTLSTDFIKHILKTSSDEISELADEIIKESGFTEGKRQQRLNNNSRVNLEINSVINNMRTDVIEKIDKLCTTELNDCFKKINTHLIGIVEGYEQNLFGEYSDLGTQALSEKLSDVNRNIGKIEERIANLNCIIKDIEDLTEN